MKYNKLVRDKIPQIVMNDGKTPIMHIASDQEYKEKLNEKLVEEAHEFIKSNDINELADLLEVVDSILDQRNITKDELNKIKSKKAEERGSFKQKVILDEVKD